MFGVPVVGNVANMLENLEGLVVSRRKFLTGAGTDRYLLTRLKFEKNHVTYLKIFLLSVFPISHFLHVMLNNGVVVFQLLQSKITRDQSFLHGLRFGRVWCVLEDCGRFVAI